MKLGEIDTIKETFSADVFIQARWREPRLDGRQMAKNIVSSSLCFTLPADQSGRQRHYVLDLRVTKPCGHDILKTVEPIVMLMRTRLHETTA